MVAMRHHRLGTRSTGNMSSARPSFSLILPSIVFGLCLGSALTYSMLFLNDYIHSFSEVGIREIAPTQANVGWHPIHVYYGDAVGLQADPSPEAWFAQVHQDEIVMDLIGNDGYFIDLAANDAKELSNTLALERHGWHGLCIEPNPNYWYGLSHRNCTVIGALVGGDTPPGSLPDKVPVKFRGVYGGMVTVMDDKMANRKKEPDAPIEYRYPASFAKVLEQFNVPSVIDYLSLDVEGAEYMILQHFPFDRYQIRIMTVERPNKQLKSLLLENGYVFLKDLVWWGETLWAHQSTGLTPDHPQIAKINTIQP
jgi:hypothetical protein